MKDRIIDSFIFAAIAGFLAFELSAFSTVLSHWDTWSIEIYNQVLWQALRPAAGAFAIVFILSATALPDDLARRRWDF